MYARIFFLTLVFTLMNGGIFAQDSVYSLDKASPEMRQRVERFLDEYIGDQHSREYRQAVGTVFLAQLHFCDDTGKPERTTIDNVKTENGETTISLVRKGTGAADFSTESDEHRINKAMTFRNKNVIALNGIVECTDYEGATCYYSFPLTDPLLDTIVKIATLEKLKLGCGFFSDAMLAKLAPLTQLKSLWLIDTHNARTELKHSYSAFDSLHGLVNLEEIVLFPLALQADADSTPFFRALPNYPQLRTLSVGGLALNRKNMEALSSCIKLESLMIDNSTLTEPCLDLLGKLKSLQTLRLTLRTNGHPVEIPHLPSLTCLTLRSSTDVQEQSIVISNQPLLRELWLSIPAKKNSIVLTDMPELTQMYLTIENVHSVEARFENLPKVALCQWRQNFRADQASIEQIKDEPFRFTQNLLNATLNLPAVQFLWLPGPLEKNVDLKKLAALSSLTRLDLYGLDVNIPDLCSHLKLKHLVIHMSWLPDDFSLENAPTLESLSMGFCIGKNITINNAPLLKQFAFMPAYKITSPLESVVLKECPALESLGGHPPARLLDLRGTKIKNNESSRNQSILTHLRRNSSPDLQILVDDQ